MATAPFRGLPEQFQWSASPQLIRQYSFIQRSAGPPRGQDTWHSRMAHASELAPSPAPPRTTLWKSRISLSPPTNAKASRPAWLHPWSRWRGNATRLSLSRRTRCPWKTPRLESCGRWDLFLLDRGSTRRMGQSGCGVMEVPSTRPRPPRGRRFRQALLLRDGSRAILRADPPNAGNQGDPPTDIMRHRDETI